ncbi:MAG: ATP-binding protein [Bacteroidetes bacterium]|nr:MAG: ATP-binding protein [Bacteroidota bacterium]
MPRSLLAILTEKLSGPRKIILLYGARQVGKTTLVREFLGSYEGKVLEINADMPLAAETLSSQNLSQLQRMLAGYNLLFIDEAQRIPDIGINLKIIHDQIPDIRVIVTGSSALDLANKVSEALTGRTWTYVLYPLSVLEWRQLDSPFVLDQRIEEFLLFGMYPEVFAYPSTREKREYLTGLVNAYLYKDILDLGGIRYPEKILNLLRLLAWQIGSQVSFSELGKQLGLSTETVHTYIELLKKGFVIFDLQGYSRNLRKEITKTRKIYFYDLGIRNALIENFNPLSQRNDSGHLWENFLICERMKRMHYERNFANFYFWRTYTGAELDFIEERDGKLFGYEMKWGKNKAKAPVSWLETYPEASFTLLNQENYLEFIA